MTAFPQYAKTSDPNVLDAIRTNQELLKTFHERAVEFSQAQGIEDGAYYSSGFGGVHTINALGGTEKPTSGRWTEHPRGGWRPYKNNPIYKDMEHIQAKENAIPGLPTFLESAQDRDWRRHIASPRAFIVDGVAFVGVSFIPEDGGDKVKPEDGGWEEIRASEFMLAMETYNDRIKSVS